MSAGRRPVDLLREKWNKAAGRLEKICGFRENQFSQFLSTNMQKKIKICFDKVVSIDVSLFWMQYSVYFQDSQASGKSISSKSGRRRPAVGRPTWPNDRHKNLLFVAGNCRNYESWCFKKRKYHVLKLCQSRFFIFYIFFDKNGENWFRAVELLRRDFGCWSADGRPTSKIPSQNFDGTKPVFSVFIKKYVKNEKSGLTKF